MPVLLEQYTSELELGKFMPEEYQSLREELEDLQSRFERIGSEECDLGHQVCHYNNERLSEESWNAFTNRFRYLSDGKWHEWHVCPDSSWCGRFFGVGKRKPEFVELAENTIGVLKRLLDVDGVGEKFFVNLPAYGGCDAWLTLIYDAFGLCRFDAYVESTWNRPPNVPADIPMRTFWSRPNANGHAYPLYPSCVTLKENVFTASSETLSLFLEPHLSLEEYPNFLGHMDFYIVPAFLPKTPVSPSPVAESLVPSLTELTSIDLKPSWNEDFKKLRLGTRTVKQYNQRAPRQKHLLRAFEEAHWPISIPNPFLDADDLGDLTPQRCLLDTIAALNGQNERQIRFEADGEGGVRWLILQGERS